MTTAIIAGGRDYKLMLEDYLALDRLYRDLDIRSVITGDATGVDFWARLWANERGITTTEFVAQWGRYGKWAGPIRNQEMIDYATNSDNPVVVILFPGGKGTSDTKSRAIVAGLEIYELGDHDHGT